MARTRPCYSVSGDLIARGLDLVLPFELFLSMYSIAVWIDNKTSKAKVRRSKKVCMYVYCARVDGICTWSMYVACKMAVHRYVGAN